MNRLLIVEDDATNLTLLETLFSSLYTVFHARDGRDVMDLMRQHHPHVVLLDMRLPGMDGWEIASRIKADPDLCNTPIIALSVQVTPADPKRALDAGCDEFVSKPFDIRQLKMLVKRYMER